MDVSYLSEVENGKKEPCLRKIKETGARVGCERVEVGAGALREDS
jgi:hypothetical protein